MAWIIKAMKWIITGALLDLKTSCVRSQGKEETKDMVLFRIIGLSGVLSFTNSVFKLPFIFLASKEFLVPSSMKNSAL